MNKKTFAFLVPAVLLLAACGPTSSDSIVPPTPRSDYTEESLSSSEVGTSSEEETSSPAATSSEESSSSAGTSSSEESSSSTGTSSSQSKPEGTEISVSFRSISVEGGYNYGDHPEEFAAFFPADLLSADPTINNIRAQSCNPEETDVRLTVGSQKSSGSIELNFVSPVKAVTLVGSDYFNFYGSGSWSGVSYTNSGVKVGEQSFEFTHAVSGETPAENTFEAVFDSPVSSLTIESQAGTSGESIGSRFFLYSLTFVI